jgi:hypothetical protein
MGELNLKHLLVKKGRERVERKRERLVYSTRLSGSREGEGGRGKA